MPLVQLLEDSGSSAIGALSFVGGKFWKVARRHRHHSYIIELIVDRIPTTHATLPRLLLSYIREEESELTRESSATLSSEEEDSRPVRPINIIMMTIDLNPITATDSATGTTRMRQWYEIIYMADVESTTACYQQIEG